MTRQWMVACSFAVIVFLGACADSDDGTMPVEISFSIKANDVPVECGSQLVGLGNATGLLTVKDLRFYLHDLALVDVEGNAHAMVLDDDGKWQADGLALLDFEDGGAECEFGNADVNTTIVGHVADEEFNGIRFSVGVPFERNHQDAATASSPLNLSAMFWSWNGGYKFVRIDMADEENNPYNFHLGSTECQSDSEGQVTACRHENRAHVTLIGANPTQTDVVFNLSELFSGVDLTNNELAPGCMAAPADSDCAPYFANFGLPWAESEVEDQKVFHFDHVE